MVRHKVIAPGMEYQRFPLVPRVFLDFTEEDGVITAVKLFDVAANQPSRDSLQQRKSVFSIFRVDALEPIRNG